MLELERLIDAAVGEAPPADFARVDRILTRRRRRRALTRTAAVGGLVVAVAAIFLLPRDGSTSRSPRGAPPRPRRGRRPSEWLTSRQLNCGEVSRRAATPCGSLSRAPAAPVCWAPAQRCCVSMRLAACRSTSTRPTRHGGRGRVRSVATADRSLVGIAERRCCGSRRHTSSREARSSLSTSAVTSGSSPTWPACSAPRWTPTRHKQARLVNNRAECPLPICRDA